MAIHGTLTQAAYEVMLSNTTFRNRYGIPETATFQEVAQYMTTLNSLYLAHGFPVEDIAPLCSWIVSLDGDLNLTRNPSLTNLDFLSNLISVGGILDVSNCFLDDISGLSNLSSVGGISMINNSLKEITFDSLVEVKSPRFLVGTQYSTGTVQSDIAGTYADYGHLVRNDIEASLPNLLSVGHDYLGHQPLSDEFSALTNGSTRYSKFHAPKLVSIRANGGRFTFWQGELTSEDLDLRSLRFLYNGARYDVDLILSHNNFENLDFIRSLESVDTLAISYNNLENINGLSNLRNVNNFLSLSNNNLTSLDPIKEITSVDKIFLSGVFDSDFFDHNGYNSFGCLLNSDVNSKIRVGLTAAYPFSVSLWDQAYPNGVEDCENIEPAPVPDITPDAFSFDFSGGSDVGSIVSSSIETITGFDGILGVTVSGGINTKIKVNDGDFLDPSIIGVFSGDTVQLQTTTSSEHNQSTAVFVTIGTSTTTWIVSTSENETPVVVNQPIDLTFEPGDEVSVDIRSIFEDPEGHELSYTIIGSPKSLSISEGKITGKITLNDIGEFKTRIVAEDSLGASASVEFLITVNTPRNTDRLLEAFRSTRERVAGEEITVEEANAELEELYNNLTVN